MKGSASFLERGGLLLFFPLGGWTPPLPPNVIKKGIGRGPCTHRLFCSRCVTSSPRYKGFSLDFSKKLKGFPKGLPINLLAILYLKFVPHFSGKVWAEVNIFELYYVYVTSRRILIEPCRLCSCRFEVVGYVDLTMPPS